MGTHLTLAIETYFCEPCSRKQGTVVAELVRMMPRAIVFDGEPIGDEWWCCPICFEKKFPVKKPRKKAGKKDEQRAEAAE